MSTANEGKALSADASSFNPPSSDQIWGAINQSYVFPDGSYGGSTPTGDMSSGPRGPPHSNGTASHFNNRPTSHYGSSSQGNLSLHGENKSGLGLWNFGGFGDDAKSRSAPPQARGGMLDDSNVNLDFMGDHGNKVSTPHRLSRNVMHFFNSIQL